MSPTKIGVSSMSALSWIANLNIRNAAQLILAASPRCDQGGGKRREGNGASVVRVMSAMGQKRTLRRVCVMSALPPKADIAERDKAHELRVQSPHV